MTFLDRELWTTQAFIIAACVNCGRNRKLGGRLSAVSLWLGAIEARQLWHQDFATFPAFGTLGFARFFFDDVDVFDLTFLTLQSDGRVDILGFACRAFGGITRLGRHSCLKAFVAFLTFHIAVEG